MYQLKTLDFCISKATRKGSRFLAFLALAVVTISGTAAFQLIRFEKTGKSILQGSTHLDLGNIEVGQSAAASIVLKNVGSRIVIIDKLNASCACTSVTTSTTRVRPGASTTLNAMITAGYATDHIGSNVAVFWHVHDSRVNGVFNTLITAHPTDFVNISPKFVNLMTIEAGNFPAAIPIKIERGNSDFQWTDVTVDPCPDISVSLKNPTIGVSQCQLSLKLKDIPAGLFSREIIFRFRDKLSGESRVRKLSVSAYINGPISTAPRTLYFGVQAADAMINGKLELRQKSGQPIKIQSLVESSNKHLFTFTIPDEADTRLILPFTLHVPTLPGSSTGDIIVHVSDGDDHSLKIPYILYVSN